ncbi:hypothetical protein [Teredinibacter franksiae]|uniref:hypothetical protein n=1 Tax=Teredinibacter franksiae TaxID=2761453 RepID=UPI001629CF05|nr:hypothetical protein [Teredinibacter franksiae]
MNNFYLFLLALFLFFANLTLAEGCSVTVPEPAVIKEKVSQYDIGWPQHYVVENFVGSDGISYELSQGGCHNNSISLAVRFVDGDEGGGAVIEATITAIKSASSYLRKDLTSVVKLLQERKNIGSYSQGEKIIIDGGGSWIILRILNVYSGKRVLSVEYAVAAQI